jgi:hypothetical protein
MYDHVPNEPAALAARWDIYGPVHKGIRLAHADILVRLGAADFAGADQTALLEELRTHLRLCAQHLKHEEESLHPALEARVPSAVHELEEQHEHHRARFAVVAARIDALAAAPVSERAAFGRELYLAFSLLVAEDLLHMHEEETRTWPTLCAHFTDAELQAIEMEILSKITPENTIAFMTRMLPAMNRAQRHGLLGGMKAGAPPEAYAAVLQLAGRPTLPATEWAALETAGLA